MLPSVLLFQNDQTPLYVADSKEIRELLEMVMQREDKLIQFKLDAANDVEYDETVICSLYQVRKIDNILSCNHVFCSVCL